MSVVLYGGQARVLFSHTHTSGCHATTVVTVDGEVVASVFVLLHKTN